MTRLFNQGLPSLFLVCLMNLCSYSTMSQCATNFGVPIKVPCNIDTANIPKPFYMCPGDVAIITQILPAQPAIMTIGTACDSMCFSKQIRSWKVKRPMIPDAIYNDTVCFMKINLENVICPKDTVIICSSLVLVDTTVGALGSPLKAQGIPCNILQIGPVKTIWIYKSAGCYKFTRQWSLMDWCTREIKPCTQTIEVKDTTKPTIAVDHTLLKASVSTDVCTGAINFPIALVSDNCTPALLIAVKIEVVGTGLSINTNGGVISGIPIGQYNAIYTANDGCNNTAIDSVRIEIFDGQAPIALCKGPKVVQINDAIGMVTLPDYAFDDGSFDRCSHDVSFKVKRMLNAPRCLVERTYDVLLDNPLNSFADQVKFCCSDHNTDVMVILRVYQGWTRPGPVSLDAYPIYSECMVSVKVIDKAGPALTCPDQVTIDCRDIKKYRVRSLNDSVYGTPVVSDMCLDKVTIDSIPYLDVCNVGSIIRRITAKDLAGNPTTCDQLIKVKNSSPFNAEDTSDWAWPKDTTFFICSANTTPAVTGLPKLKDPSCTKVAYNFEDEVYEFATGACKKIIRKWSVTDWCQLISDNPYAGKWTHMQLIVVMDTAKPVLTVPANFTVNNFDSVCGPTLVTVPLPSATDCTPSGSLDWRYSLDLFSDGLNPIEGNGKSASQMMPNGIHTLTFYVNDLCGNISSKNTIITVKDAKKPTPVAIFGLATDLSKMNGVGMARVFARHFFVLGSVLDNCTPYSKLKFSYSTNVNDSVRIFTCDSIGTRTVRLWVTDEAGNQDLVTTFIVIQNNMNACTNPAPTPAPELRTIGIGGNLMTESKKPIDLVSVKIMQGNQAVPDPAVLPGKYTAQDLVLGQSYDIIPKKDINPLNGVSTVDLIMMQKHILGIKAIQSPYQLIAADIDRNGEINAIDLLELRKMLLGIDKHFANNESWRFVDALYKFSNLHSALSESFNEKYSIKDLEKPMQINFVGIKIGDLNESNQSGELTALESRGQGHEESLLLVDQTFKENEIVKLAVKGDQLKSITGFQISLQNDRLELLNIEEGVFPMSNVFAHDLNGSIKLNGYLPYASVLNKESNWFVLVFKAKKAGILSKALQVQNNTDLKSEVYDDVLNSSGLNIKWINSTPSGFTLDQNIPNPFTSQTRIRYSLPQAAWVNLKIVDLNGRVLVNSKVFATKGPNDWIVDQSRFNVGGIYYYKVESPFGIESNKMILLQ